MKPRSCDIAVIGAGAAGIEAALTAARLGAHTVLLHAGRLGGRNLWSGSVPTATLARSARVFETLKRSSEFGVHVEKPRLIWPSVRLRLAAVQDEIRDLYRTQLREASVEIVPGEVSFDSPESLEVRTGGGSFLIQAATFIVATGGGATEAAVNRETGHCLSAEQLFKLPTLPRTVAIVGDGWNGAVLAQSLCRFGCKVTLIEAGRSLLRDCDQEISEFLQRLMEQEGVRLVTGAKVLEAAASEEGVSLRYEAPGGEQETIVADRAVSLQPESSGLDLKIGVTGVAMRGDIVQVDRQLRTSNPRIMACGGVTGAQHQSISIAQARTAARNAVAKTAFELEASSVPRTLLTDPEVAVVGCSGDELEAQQEKMKVTRARWDILTRALIEGETEGVAKILSDQDGRLLGAHLAGPAAGEIIHSLVPLLQNRLSVERWAEWPVAAPAMTEILASLSSQHP